MSLNLTKTVARFTKTFLSKESSSIGIFFHRSGSTRVRAKHSNGQWKFFKNLDSREFDQDPVVLGFPFLHFFFRTCKVPVRGKKRALRAASLSLESDLLFSLEETLSAGQILDVDNGESTAGLLLTRKDVFFRSLSDLEVEGELADLVTAIPYGLAALNQWNFQDQSERLILYLGEEQGCLALVKGLKLLACSHLAFEQRSEECLKRAFALAIVNLQSFGATLPENVFLISSHVPELGLEDFRFMSFPREAFPTDFSPEDILAAAFALSLFEPKLPTFHRPKSKRWQGIRLYRQVALSALLLMGSSALLGTSVLWPKQRALQEDIHKLFPEMTSFSLETSIEKLEQSLSHPLPTSPWHGLSPQLGPFLTWLAFEMERIEGKLRLERLQYDVRSFPSFAEPSNPWKVEVQIWISSEQGKSLHALRKLLCESNPFLDPEQDTHWQVENGLFYGKINLHNLGEA